MFRKLQEDANKIEIETEKLYAKIPSVINGYTYNNKVSSEILKQKLKLFNEIEVNCQSFLGHQHKTFQLFIECERDVLEIQNFIKNVMSDLNISISTNETEVSADQSTSLMEMDTTDPNNTSDNSAESVYDLSRVVIGRHQNCSPSNKPSMAPDTPAIKSSKIRFFDSIDNL